MEATMATIREIREQQGLSQIELSAKSTVSVRTISWMETGRAISRVSLKRVCQALGVNPQDVEGVNLTKNR